MVLTCCGHNAVHAVRLADVSRAWRIRGMPSRTERISGNRAGPVDAKIVEELFAVRSKGNGHVPSAALRNSIYFAHSGHLVNGNRFSARIEQVDLSPFELIVAFPPVQTAQRFYRRGLRLIPLSDRKPLCRINEKRSVRAVRVFPEQLERSLRLAWRFCPLRRIRLAGRLSKGVLRLVQKRWASHRQIYLYRIFDFLRDVRIDLEVARVQQGFNAVDDRICHASGVAHVRFIREAYLRVCDRRSLVLIRDTLHIHAHVLVSLVAAKVRARGIVVAQPKQDVADLRFIRRIP